MKILTRLFAAALAIGFTLNAHAEWPDRPIKMIVPFPPGNASDVAMRIVGQKLSAQLGQPVVIENRAGAGGVIGMAFGAKQPADGYTLSMGSTGPLAIAPSVHPAAMPYIAEKDFVAVGAVAWAPQVLVVRKEFPARNFREFWNYAKRPGVQLRFGSAGNGTTNHLIVSQLLQQTGIKADHIPYQGGAKAVIDLIGGQLDFVCDNIPIVQSSLSSGHTKALAVTSAERLSLMPDVPTLKEQGVDNFDLQGWILIVAPTGTPDPIVRRLSEATELIMKMPDVRKRLNDLGLVPMDLPRDRLPGFIQAEARKWKDVARISGAAQSLR